MSAPVVPRWSSSRLAVRAVAQDAKASFFSGDFVQALQLYVKGHAIMSAFGNAGYDEAIEGTILHNIASCLHNLNELSEAQEWYGRAIVAFRAKHPGFLSKLVNGDLNEKRIGFSEERMARAAQGLPPTDEYLDSSGRKAASPADRLKGGANRRQDLWGTQAS